jgi:hypothetical protein
VGRVDATEADIDVTGELPGAGFNLQQLIDSFARKGFSIREFVALSGAHTVCSYGFAQKYLFAMVTLCTDTPCIEWD